MKIIRGIFLVKRGADVSPRPCCGNPKAAVGERQPRGNARKSERHSLTRIMGKQCASVDVRTFDGMTKGRRRKRCADTWSLGVHRAPKGTDNKHYKSAAST